MSSTKRSAKREAHMGDYYRTPVPVVVAFLNAFKTDCPAFAEKMKGDVLDPCAGGKIDLTAVDPVEGAPVLEVCTYPVAILEAGFKPHMIDAMDIREDSAALYRGMNYLETPCSNYDVTITNPPYNWALEIIQKAIREAPEGAYIIMLLRLNFFGSQSRREFFNNFMPKYAYVHSKRIGFTDDGKTDSIEYAHYVWVKGENPKYCSLKVI
jgi:hypothetical protein